MAPSSSAPSVAVSSAGHRRGLRARLEAWWRSRLPVDDSLLLTQHNVYILPTPAGLAYAATLVVLLLASINYQLSLGYLLTFLLAGAGVAALYLTHANLRGLQLRLKPPAPVFAGEAAQLEVTLTSTARVARHGVGLRFRPAGRGSTGEAPRPGRGRRSPSRSRRRRDGPSGWVWADVAAQSQSRTGLALVLPTRGWHPVPPVQIETRFPLGVFRVWALWRPAARALAYPRPETAPPPLPVGNAQVGPEGSRRPSEGGETEGVRAYRRGDPLKAVLWKKAAKGEELVSRDTSMPASREIWLDLSVAGLADIEARLSRLAAWVLLAESQGLRYGLRLPGLEFPPDHGEVHRRRCLAALAEWG